MLPGSETCAVLSPLAVAVLFSVGQLPTAVTALTAAVNDEPCEIGRAACRRAGVASLAVMAQPTVPVVQVSVAPEGRGSLITTLFAVPGPLLVTTMVKVAVPPAVTVPPSGVF